MNKIISISIIGFVFYLTCSNIYCQTPPYLYRVYPLHETPKQMEVYWNGLTSEVYFIKKAINGIWGNWEITGTSLSYVDNGPFNDNDIYKYKVSYLIGTNYIESNELSNSFSRVWPVKINSCNNESYDILHNYYQLIAAPGNGFSSTSYYLHEGLDIQGSASVVNECVVGAIGGKGNTYASISLGAGIRYNLDPWINKKFKNNQNL